MSDDLAWPFPIRPRTDELLTSWLVRVANAHAHPPTLFTSFHLPSAATWNRDLDRTCSDDLAERIGAAGGLDPSEVIAMTLRPWLPRLTQGFRPDRGILPLILAAGIRHRTRTLHALQYCPACIADEPTSFRRQWRLAFVVACPKHQVVLADSCPRCDAPVIPHRGPPNYLSRCHVCEGHLAFGHAARTPPAAVTRLQETLSETLNGRIEGPPFSTDTGLRTFRQLAGMLGSRWRQERLRCALKLPPAEHREESPKFETSRVAKRVDLTETVALWTRDWPQSFVEGAKAIGLTQQTFARSRPSPEFAAVLKELPTGRARNRPPWKSLIEDAELRRLRRRDPDAARLLREQRLIAVALERMKR